MRFCPWKGALLARDRKLGMSRIWDRTTSLCASAALALAETEAVMAFSAASLALMTYSSCSLVQESMGIIVLMSDPKTASEMLA